MTFLVASLTTGSANLARWILGLPRTFFNLLALVLFYIKIYFIAFILWHLLWLLSPKVKLCQRVFEKHQCIALTDSLSCEYKERTSKAAAGIKDRDFFFPEPRLVNLNQAVLLSHNFHPSFWSAFQIIYFSVFALRLGLYGHHTFNSKRHCSCPPQGCLNSSPPTHIFTTQFSPFPWFCLRFSFRT